MDWDFQEYRRLVAAFPKAGPYAKESLGFSQSRRHTCLGKAFQNYRRRTLHKLKRNQEMARFFKFWSVVSAGRAPSVQDLLWNDSNMHAFITQHVNYESIMRWRSAQVQRVLARALATQPPPPLAVRAGVAAHSLAEQVHAGRRPQPLRASAAAALGGAQRRRLRAHRDGAAPLVGCFSWRAQDDAAGDRDGAKAERGRQHNQPSVGGQDIGGEAGSPVRLRLGNP